MASAAPFDALEYNGEVLISTDTQNAIVRFTPDGTFNERLASQFNIPALDFPQQMAEASNGNLLVCVFSTGVILEFEPDGTLVGQYDPGTLSLYRGIAELDNGNLLVTTTTGVYEVTRTGLVIDTEAAGSDFRYITRHTPAVPPTPARHAPPPRPGPGHTLLRSSPRRRTRPNPGTLRRKHDPRGDRVMKSTIAILAALASPAIAQPTTAYIVEGSGFFGAPGVQLGTLAEIDLANPANVTILSRPADDLRFGGADVNPTNGDLVGFENSTNAMRILDRTTNQQTLIESIGWMESGVAGFTYSNDGTIAYAVTNVSGFNRIVEANAATGAVIEVHNILGNALSSLATVPPGHPTLPEGEIVGLALTGFGSLNFVRLDLKSNQVISEQGLLGVGFEPQFETGLDFAADGTLYALVQGFDEIAPDVFVEISSHLYTLDVTTATLTQIGVVQAEGTWDAVGLAINDGPAPCAADCDANGTLNLDDIDCFVFAFLAADLDAADCDGSGSLNLDDLDCFVAAFLAGCP